MAEFKDFPTLVVASTATGISLTHMSISTIHECAEWLCGHPVWTHELVHGPTKDEYISEAFAQFPDLPTFAETSNDWQAAAVRAVAVYGETLRVRQGAFERHESPLATLQAVAPGEGAGGPHNGR